MMLRALLTLHALLALHCDRIRWAGVDAGAHILAGRRGAAGVALAAAAAVALAASGEPLAAAGVVAAATTVAVSGWRYRWQRWRRMRQLCRGVAVPAHLPPAADSLRALGLEGAVIERILADGVNAGEIAIAAFDQSNRVLSRIGPIPAYRADLIEAGQFEARRHRIELVVVSGVLAVKKQYREPETFVAEALALDALREVRGVPALVGIRPRGRVLYQSFLPGRSLGNELSARGLMRQRRLWAGYPGAGNWSEGASVPAERAEALQVLRAVMADAQIEQLGRLLLEVHRAGVAVRDIKYGNVMLDGGRVALCDFDQASTYYGNERRFLRERDVDRDKLNYFFGIALPTLRSLHAEGEAHCADRSDRGAYYGRGFHTGRPAVAAAATRRWWTLRRGLPELRGRTVLDLGSGDGVVALEMLRAGAAAVTACEPDPGLAAFARVNHRWFECLDNRAYDFRVVEVRIGDLAAHPPGGCNLVTVSHPPAAEIADQLPELLTALPEGLEALVMLCGADSEGGDRLRRRLAAAGWAAQRSQAGEWRSRQLFVARRA
jgi:hypothetical protein